MNSQATKVSVILLVLTMISAAVASISFGSMTFAQTPANNTGNMANNTGNMANDTGAMVNNFSAMTSNTGSAPFGSLSLTNFDIPSIDLTLPDGTDTAPDFRSIYFNNGGNGQTIYAYYDDYGLPQDKPKVKAGDKINIVAFPSHSDTPKPEKIDVSLSKILTGGETGNFTAMTLDKPVDLQSSGDMYTLPANLAPGNYIMNTIVKYPLGGIALVYSTQFQVS